MKIIKGRNTVIVFNSLFSAIKSKDKDDQNTIKHLD